MHVEEKTGNGTLALEDGSRVAVVGGGPAGSFFSYFLLQFAQRIGREIQVDIYEPRDFWALGPAGCNMCGGIVSESLVQNLAIEGIDLPDNLVQRGIDSYVLHTEAGSCHIDTPVRESRIAAVHRGGGPRRAQEGKWESFDAHLLKLAISVGANFYGARITDLRWKDGRPEVQAAGQPHQVYDLLVGAVGVNSPDLKLFENLGFHYQRPRVVKTYVTELDFGPENVRALFGRSMHVFLLNIPRLDFAALIPKGDYVTMCLLGRDIDKNLVASFFEHPVVRHCFPAGWRPPADACHCSPRMFYGPAQQPFTDRVVLVGDSAVSRLYKDGIGAAYRTAKAAARTAVFSGVSAEDFGRQYVPEYRRISRDNLFGRLIFAVVHVIRYSRLSARAVLRISNAEKRRAGNRRRMSMVLWDTFTGSAPYRNIFLRTLHPFFLARFFLAHVLSAGRRSRESAAKPYRPPLLKTR